MFKVKKIAINNGSTLNALLTHDDAKELGLFPKDKVKVICSHSKKSIICDLEIFDCDKHCNIKLKNGELGLFEHAYENLSCISKTLRASLIPAPKPKSLEFVRKRFEEQREISQEEFTLIIQDILDNKYSDITKTFFVLACAAHPLSDEETIGLTKAMVNVGKVLNFKTNKNDIIVDKHCIGGIPNNRTTPIVIPIIAAKGLKIPKTSSRSITSPAGTADTMEVFSNVEVELTKMHSIVQEVGGCLVWGGGVALSPADDVIIEIEHPLEIDSEGQMIASILSKKKCAGSTHVLIDIPIGKTAKISSKEKALRLKKRFEKIGKAIDLEILAIISNGDEPIGCGIGPYLEALDIKAVLENSPQAPEDLKEKSIEMAGLIFEMSKVSKKGKGYNLAKQILESGLAKEKFEQIIEAQGKKEFPKPAKYKVEIKAHKSGILKEVNNKLISRTAFVLGAPKNILSGLKILKKIGDRIDKGETILELHSSTKLKLKYGEVYVEEHQDIFKIE